MGAILPLIETVTDKSQRGNQPECDIRNGWAAVGEGTRARPAALATLADWLRH